VGLWIQDISAAPKHCEQSSTLDQGSNFSTEALQAEQYFGSGAPGSAPKHVTQSSTLDQEPKFRTEALQAEQFFGSRDYIQHQSFASRAVLWIKGLYSASKHGKQSTCSALDQGTRFSIKALQAEQCCGSRDYIQLRSIAFRAVIWIKGLDSATKHCKQSSALDQGTRFSIETLQAEQCLDLT
jgi:hypothetical protein